MYWKIGFPTLELYKTEWLRQAAETANTEFAEDLTTGIFPCDNTGRYRNHK